MLLDRERVGPMADEERTEELADLRQVFAVRLREARRRAGLTQPALAELAGPSVSRHILANCEGARTLPSLTGYVALCTALGMDPGPLTRAPNCSRCGDVPPAGFRCNSCGTGGDL